MKGGDKIVFKSKPVRHLFSFKQIRATQRTLLQKIQMTANLSLGYQASVPRQYHFFERAQHSFFCFGA
jgi:hypothetical protein